MPCIPFTMKDNGPAILCVRGRRTKPKPCACCGRPSSKLCDFERAVPMIHGGIQSRVQKTCDKPLCGNCAVKVGPEIDHCPDHPRAEPS